MQAFLAALIEKLVFDLGAKIVSWLQGLWATSERSKKEDALNLDNEKKLDDAMKTDDLAKKARAAEDVWNG